MKIKEKICKQCGTKFKPYNTLQVVCSGSCAIKFNSKKEIDKRVKVMKKESQSIPELKALARVVFQTWVRLRDHAQGCISCPKTDAKWDAGHYFKAEVYSGLIFVPMNVNKQCSYCNCQLTGNLIEYRKGLIVKYGEAAVESLEAQADISRVHKFTREELQELITTYRTKIKELKTASNNVGKPSFEVKFKG